MAIITNFFQTQSAEAAARQEAVSHRVPVVCQVWKNSRKVWGEGDKQFVSLRAKVLEFDAEKGKDLGLVKGQDIRLRFFSEAPISSTNGENPFATKQFILAAWIQLDAEPFQANAYDKVDNETGEITTITPDPVMQGRIRGGAFGATLDEAVANMDILAEELKATKKAKVEAKKEAEKPVDVPF